MSWLARTIANSLKLDEEDEDNFEQEQQPENPNNSKSESEPSQSQSESASPSTHSPTARGVKEDISEITKSLSRQFWGVASFLAPPPDPDQDHDPRTLESDPNLPDEDVIAGIRSDFAEIGGKFKSGISKISGNKTVSEFTKIASSFLQIGSDEEYDLDGVVGVTEEVVAFARNLAMHPETWLDFPLPDDPDSDDFDLSDAQQEHALAVEHLAPRLAALRMELCPGYMSDGCFWKIYFVLLHPKLSKNDAVFLSTPHIMEARASLTQALDIRRKEKKEPDLISIPSKEEEQEQLLSVPSNTQLESLPLQTSAVEKSPSMVVDNIETEGHTVKSDVTQPIDKPVVKEAPSMVVDNVETEEHTVKSDVTQPIDKPVVKEAPSMVVDNVETEEHTVKGAVIQPIDSSVVKEAPIIPSAEQSSSGSTNRFSYEAYEDDADADDWLKEDDSSEMVGPSGTSIHTGGDDEDVSFSDLEEDDGDVHASYKKTSGSDSSTKDSRDWVQLGRSSPNSDKDINSLESRNAGSEISSARNSMTKDSNDWLNVDDIDVI
ncbi:uncharacterized protein LOC131652291 [Vicia villosa]|uniref:uncharacterized protein LOC131652285 n=1 Tax=Vicia villosa TaxID=3911 RepID=UPI00273A8E38|nr:uncharacterized protein LOC131652285 [Vicia villosa]XP_058778092.1 uncharacterized protein LOC131652285 [Vicia villosa]XP_058778098.1 uncharacterized protein LOC131652291 [Vicia villosa]XP_058778099.1 uncharacterized protein LOC131652291 [Vicia villosa]